MLLLTILRPRYQSKINKQSINGKNAYTNFSNFKTYMQIEGALRHSFNFMVILNIKQISKQFRHFPVFKKIDDKTKNRGKEA